MKTTLISYLKVFLERVITFFENRKDSNAVKTSNFAKGRNFEEVAKELNI